MPDKLQHGTQLAMFEPCNGLVVWQHISLSQVYCSLPAAAPGQYSAACQIVIDCAAYVPNQQGSITTLDSSPCKKIVVITTKANMAVTA